MARLSAVGTRCMNLLPFLLAALAPMPQLAMASERPFRPFGKRGFTFGLRDDRAVSRSQGTSLAYSSDSSVFENWVKENLSHGHDKAQAWSSHPSEDSTKALVDLFVTETIKKLPTKNDQKHHKKTPKPLLSSVTELRTEILDHERRFKDVKVRVAPQNFTHEALFDHKVVELIVKRGKERSKPGHRAVNDTEHLALAIEGGGVSSWKHIRLCCRCRHVAQLTFNAFFHRCVVL